MSDLATRARDYALIAGDFGATVARECATELDRQDAEIARLTALVKDPLTTHKGRTAEQWHTAAGKWYGMWNVANERANKAEDDLAALRAAVMALPEYRHVPSGMFAKPCLATRLDHGRGPCNCGAAAANAAARLLAGEGK